MLIFVHADLKNCIIVYFIGNFSITKMDMLVMQLIPVIEISFCIFARLKK
jgi:hypothetical protein